MEFDFAPFEDDVLIMGRGGTGKSFLLDRLFLRSARYPLWLYDLKSKYSHLAQYGYHVTRDLAKLPYGRAVFQPRSQDISQFDSFCAKANRLSNLVVAVEEAHLLSGKYSFKSESFEILVKAGRPQGLTWVVITRRPQQLHNDILSDSDHIFCFALELPSDILYVQKWIGQDVQLHLPAEYRTSAILRSQKQLPEHSFVYKCVKTGQTDVGRL